MGNAASMELYRVPAADKRKQRQHLSYNGTNSPTLEDIEDARQGVLKSIQKRKDIAEWIRENRNALRKSRSDAKRRQPSRQNLMFSQVYDIANKELEESIKCYASYSCRELSAALAISLPVELRMTIFGFVAAQPTVVAPGSRGMNYQNYQNYNSNMCGLDITSMMLSKHYLQQASMAPLAEEVLQAFFRTNTFHIYDSFWLAQYTKPALINWIGPSSIVPTDHMRRMVVELRGDAVDHCPEARTRNGRGMVGVLRPVKEICESLEPLLTIKHPQGLRLEIVVAENLEGRLEDTLSSLTRTRRHLIAAGIKVRVTCRYYSTLRYPPSLDAYYDCAKKKEWQAKLAAHRNGRGTA